MGEWVRTNDGRPLKTTDAMLDYISLLHEELDDALARYVAERVAHRITKRELMGVVEMKLEAGQ